MLRESSSPDHGVVERQAGASTLFGALLLGLAALLFLAGALPIVSAIRRRRAASPAPR
ncbi:MAG TPA: hypothetical protein RMH99_03395 [Sandaracinaceae bacterium LLY-WYZ-13_1]|nr:hypothetical protein [Sandaracinaceae bacterium LLY-WYZ-13_1]